MWAEILSFEPSTSSFDTRFLRNTRAHLPIFVIKSNMKWPISQIKSEIFRINIKYSVLRPRATMLQGSQEVKFAVAQGTEVHQVSSNFLGRSIFRLKNK